MSLKLKYAIDVCAKCCVKIKFPYIDEIETKNSTGDKS